MRISDWSSDVCSSDLFGAHGAGDVARVEGHQHHFGAFEVDDARCAQKRGTFGGIAEAGRFLTAAQSVHDLGPGGGAIRRSEEHTSELQSLMRNSYAVFCLKKKKNTYTRAKTHVRHKNVQTKAILTMKQ